MALALNANVTASPPPEDEHKTITETCSPPPALGNTQLTEEKGIRTIGKWIIKETLGKGGYSWVKRGLDKTSKKVYALKFMERRKDKNGNIPKAQIRQVETEIEVLRKVGRNENIIRLFAYNLNQRYPDRNGNQRAVILLVLEYCPGGELFDLLYYTECLEAILARTYFHGLCSGIKCLHSLGIIHRDIKPQNLLLDSSYNLKITDFGLSKIINLKAVRDNDLSNAKLLNPRVGTKGYQAPEIVEMNKHWNPRQPIINKSLYYNNSCDIFAMGVVLFILMTGYPPFKSAELSDKWYCYIINGDYQSFWKAHRNSGLKKSETDLITRMLFYEKQKRISIDKIEQHSFFKGATLRKDQLTKVLTYRHQEMELKRSMDDTKQQILQYSVNAKANQTRPLLPHFKDQIIKKGYKLDRHPPVLENINANMIKSIYTTSNAYEVLQEIKIVIEDDMRGMLIDPKCNQIFEDKDETKKEEIDIDIDNFCLKARIAHLKEDEYENMEFEGTTIHVQIYWDQRKSCNLVQFNIVMNDKMRNNLSFQERMDKWKKLKNAFLRKASNALTGLPQKEKNVDPDIQELYKQCFPQKKNKK